MTDRCDKSFIIQLDELLDSPESIQLMQALITASRCYHWISLSNPPRIEYNPTFSRDMLIRLPEIPEILGIQVHRAGSMMNVQRFVECMLDSGYDMIEYFRGFQNDSARSGIYRYDVGTWNAFVACAFIQFMLSQVQSDPDQSR